MKSLRYNERYYALAFLSPFLLSVAVFFAYALIRALYYSFTDFNLFDEPNLVGFKNYIALFSEPLFLKALSNTLFYSIIATALQTVFGLFMAMAINQKVRGLGFFRTIYYFPAIMSSAAITLIFLWIFQKDGFFNQLISFIAVHYKTILVFIVIGVAIQFAITTYDKKQGHKTTFLDPYTLFISCFASAVIVYFLLALGVITVEYKFLQINWLSTGSKAGPLTMPLWAITIQNVFTTMASMMLLFLAGLQNVPTHLYEAATLDGASKWQRFTNVTVPAMKPIIFLVVTLGFMGTLKLFDQIALYGSSVPIDAKITLAYYVYKNVFPSGAIPAVGMASSAAFVLAIITLIVVWAQRFIGLKHNNDD